MENKYNILLNSKKNKSTTNADEHVSIDLSVTENHFPVDDVISKLNEYDQYMKEKDASNIYRLVYTINPVCSNVLFNRITEIVKDEGTDQCQRVTLDGTEINSKYNWYMFGQDNTGRTQQDLIRNTGYSHPDLGNFVYKPGYDIFSNHWLRQKDLTVVNKLRSNTHNTKFNTIEDSVRDDEGNSVKVIYDENPSGHSETLYYYDTIDTFDDAITNNLKEENGWIGFTNHGTFEFDNVYWNNGKKQYSVNRCLNNRERFEFVDMYPGRELYSFVPKVNKFRHRLEKNWDICLTYPYKNDNEHPLVTYTNEAGTISINGIESQILLDDNETIVNYLNNYNLDNERQDIIFYSCYKNNLNINDTIRLTFIVCNTNNDDNPTIITSSDDVVVKNVGYNDYDTQHYFTVSASDLMNVINTFKSNNFDDDNILSIRVTKIVNGRPCKYYMRMFKRIPNFRGTDVYDDAYISDEEINKYCLTGFTMSTNKLGFGLNAYGDSMAQIIINDDVRLNGLRDNLGRDLSEIYLTIVKTNRGWEDWYLNNNFTGETVEQSHAFGPISSGVDLLPEFNDYNIHRLHKLQYKVDGSSLGAAQSSITECVGETKSIEENISIDGGILNGVDNGLFYGDIVEFVEETITETVLEDIYHRFNTAQRELVSDEFRNLIFDEISAMTAGSITVGQYSYLERDSNGDAQSYPLTATSQYNANIDYEGYYYKPHYRLQIKEFDTTVESGRHTKISINEYTKTNDGFAVTTDKNYYMNVGETIRIYSLTTDEATTGIIASVSGKNFENLVINCELESDDLDNYIMYKVNSEMPSYAYDMNDRSGMFYYRQVVPSKNIRPDSPLYDSVFTNGAHYFHQNINFYVRRQDPFGDYGLSYAGMQCPDVTQTILSLEQKGQIKDVTYADYVINEGGPIC